MQKDFHYYATYCAAHLAGYSHEESMIICYSAQFVDYCSKTFLSSVNGPKSAETTQLQMEMMNARTDVIGLQNITRIWASFHFLPGDLYAKKPRCSRNYRNKYRLICNTNSNLLLETVKLAKNKSLQAVGVAMHVLADTWAHRYFAGTPSFVINNTSSHFYELIVEDGKEIEKKLVFRHSPSVPDDVQSSTYTNTVYQTTENSIMNLGHGRAGHLPDYSYIRYKYLPAWGDYEEILKDNPSDYYKAFCQMVYAMRYLRGDFETFEKDFEYSLAPFEYEIRMILEKRQLNACEDWKKFAEKLSGETIEDFDLNKYKKEYEEANRENKGNTFLGLFFDAGIAQKSMVTKNIYKSGNRLAGFSF